MCECECRILYGSGEAGEALVLSHQLEDLHTAQGGLRHLLLHFIHAICISGCRTAFRALSAEHSGSAVTGRTRRTTAVSV